MVYTDLPRCYQHTLKIAILDWSESPEGYRYSYLLEHLENALTVLPMLRWKLSFVPFGLNHPVWVEDLDFDLSHQVRHIACPAPGDDRAMCELISELYAYPLDKSRPLWQAWIVDGLERGRVAFVLLLHHAYCDGAGAASLFRGLVAPDRLPVKDSMDYGVNSRKNPGWWSMLCRGLLDVPLMIFRERPPLIRTAVTQYRTTRQYKAQAKRLPPSPGDAPDSALNTVYSHARTFSYRSFRLADFRAVSRHFKTTINDVLIAICAGAIRRYYIERNLSRDQPLVVSVPVTNRTDAQRREILGNYFSSSFVYLPIHLDDPIERLGYAAESGRVMKDLIAVTGGGGELQMLNLVPPIVYEFANWALRRTSGQMKIAGNISISNVRGPGEEMHLAGARVERWLSIGQVVAGMGLNVTAWSYCDQFNVCIMAEKKVVPDGERFLDHLVKSFDEYRELCSESVASCSSTAGLS